MAADLNLQLVKLLDQYDEMRRAVEERGRQAKADSENFLKRFADLSVNVVRPVFESAGVTLKERGHDFSISAVEYSSVPDGKTTEAAVSIRIVPAGMESDARAPSLSFVTRHYNKTVSISSTYAPPQPSGPAGQRGDYQLTQIDKDLVELEVLKLVTGMVNR